MARPFLVSSKIVQNVNRWFFLSSHILFCVLIVNLVLHFVQRHFFFQFQFFNLFNYLFNNWKWSKIPIRMNYFFFWMNNKLSKVNILFFVCFFFSKNICLLVFIIVYKYNSINCFYLKKKASFFFKYVFLIDLHCI